MRKKIAELLVLIYNIPSIVYIKYVVKKPYRIKTLLKDIELFREVLDYYNDPNNPHGKHVLCWDDTDVSDIHVGWFNVRYSFYGNPTIVVMSIKTIIESYITYSKSNRGKEHVSIRSMCI